MKIQRSTLIDKISFGILVVFAALFASITFVNHYNFRTDALDLGAYINATYDYSHGSWNDSSSFLTTPVNFLSDHFDLLVILFSPLSWIFRDWTLLLLQWLALLAGAFGVYRYFILREGSESFARSAMLFYLFQFGIFGALSFNYHSNVIAAALVPFLFIAVEQQRRRMFLIILFTILIAKESMSLWMFFVLTGLSWLYRSHPWRNFLAIVAIACIGWFFIVTSVIMPALTPDGGLTQFKFSILGSKLSDAVPAIFTRPNELLDALFTNHLGADGLNGIKEEFIFLFLLSGGLVLLARPVFLWMIIPIYVMKMWSDRTLLWGINYHYNIEFVPFFSIGVFYILETLRDPVIRKRMVIVCVLLTAGVSVRCMDHTAVWVRRETIRIYQHKHWQSLVNRKAANSAIATIPADAIVTSQSCLQPQIAWRDKAYLFPVINDARYILLAPATETYPLKREEFDHITDSLKTCGNWKVTFDQDGILLLEVKR
jgi:uncharacterized membrane protein